MTHQPSESFIPCCFKLGPETPISGCVYGPMINPIEQ